MSAITRGLSPEAIVALNWYGQIQRQHPEMSLHAGNLAPYFDGPDGRSRFDMATRELRDKDRLWTDYAVGAVPGGDAFGMMQLNWVGPQSRTCGSICAAPKTAHNHQMEPDVPNCLCHHAG